MTKIEITDFTDGVQAHNQWMRNAINTDGVYVRTEDGYGYTVGLSTRGFPELAMRGNDEGGVRTRLFDLYYAAVKHAAIALKPGPVDGLFFDEVSLKAMAEDEKRGIFYGCRTLFGSWDFECLQVVEGDSRHVF